MLYDFLHSNVYRARNKFNKTLKRKVWASVPHQEQTTYFNTDVQLFEPHLLGPSTIFSDCTSASAIKNVLAVYEKLRSDRYLDFAKNYYKQGLKNFGDKWIYADINTALYGISKNVNVANYLEIGVRRGRSMAVVASQRPECKIFGFDLWIPEYAGVDNPGKDFVVEELKNVGYKGELKFIDGDSKKTVPNFFSENPDLYFDLITVDGDHSRKGAIADLKNVIPRLKVGGFLVFDDICSQEHPYLEKVWNKLIVNDKRFITYTFTELGLGVGFAIRRY